MILSAEEHERAANQVPHHVTGQPRHRMVSSAFRLLNYWHLCSLDAPTVAVTWTAGFCSVTHVSIPAAVYPAMFIVVWALYALDRIVDGTTGDESELEARHHFHRIHRRRFTFIAVVGFIVLTILIPKAGTTILRREGATAAVLSIWFLIVHLGRHKRLAKEAAVGLFFAVACSLPSFAGVSRLQAGFFSQVVVFGWLCYLNCIAIHRWEQQTERIHALQSTIRMAALLRPALVITAVVEMIFAVRHSGSLIAEWIAAACLLLLALDFTKKRFAAVSLRALADLALLTPLLSLIVGFHGHAYPRQVLVGFHIGLHR